MQLDWREELLQIYVRPAPVSELRSSIHPPGVLLDAIIAVGGGPRISQENLLDKDRLAHVISHYAKALPEHGRDVLHGDFGRVVAAQRADPEPAQRKWVFK